MANIQQKNYPTKIQYNNNTENLLLKLPELDFGCSKYCFDQFAKQVNTELSEKYEKNPNLTKEFLKDSHSTLFYSIIRLMRKQIYDNNFRHATNDDQRVINPLLPPMLKTSNTELQNKHEGLVNVSTIYRRLKRLQKYGIITEKKLHGHHYEYEISINPEILVFFDKTNKGYIPQNSLLNTPYGNDLLKHKIAICNVSSLYLNDSKNKELNKRSKLLETENASKYSFENSQNVSNNFGNSIKNDSFLNDSQQNKENSFASQKNYSLPGADGLAKIQDKYKEMAFKSQKTIEHLQKMAAIRLLVMYINILMKYSSSGKTMELDNELQKEITLKYLEDKYFSNCKTIESINQIFVKYEWSIKKAEEIVKYRRSKGLDGYVQYARQWFAAENYAGGFVGLFKKHEDWMKRNQQKNQERADRKIKIANRNKYNEVVNRYMRHQISYTQMDNYIKHNIAEYYPLMIAEMQAGGLKTVIFQN